METKKFYDRKEKRKPAADMSTMVYGKLPPQAKDLEEAVLGAIMLDKSAFDIVVEILKPECFYVDAHQRIFKAFQSLAQKSLPIDILTVVEELKISEELDIVGGPYYVTKLTNAVVSVANIEAHSSIVLQKFVQRELIRVSGEVISDAYEDCADIFELMDDVDAKFTAITAGTSKKTYSNLSDAVTKVINRIDELKAKNQHVTGVHTGYFDLNRITHGWQPADLIILAARPSVGKTAFALNLARNAAMHPTNPNAVGFLSLEMSERLLVQRLLSAESEVLLEKISNGQLEDYESAQLTNRGVAALANVPIFIDDTSALTLYDAKIKARNLKRKENIGLLIIDYLQLMGGDDSKGNREQQISGISRGLKGLAKELNIPIIALSQLSRAPELRKGEGKMPQLSDLRESGAIEQDADMVMFMYRPEYYEINNDEMGESTRGETHIRIAKHRNGSLETIRLRANLAIQKFTSPDNLQEIKTQINKGTVWTPVKTIQGNFDQGFDEETPF